MESIKIFLVVMSCSPDALLCENVSDSVAYADIPACHAARARVLGAATRTPGPGRMIMARCRYVLAKEPPSREGPEEWRSADHLAR